MAQYWPWPETRRGPGGHQNYSAQQISLKMFHQSNSLESRSGVFKPLRGSQGFDQRKKLAAH